MDKINPSENKTKLKEKDWAYCREKTTQNRRMDSIKSKKVISLGDKKLAIGEVITCLIFRKLPNVILILVLGNTAGNAEVIYVFDLLSTETIIAFMFSFGNHKYVHKSCALLKLLLGYIELKR